MSYLLLYKIATFLYTYTYILLKLLIVWRIRATTQQKVKHTNTGIMCAQTRTNQVTIESDLSANHSVHLARECFWIVLLLCVFLIGEFHYRLALLSVRKRDAIYINVCPPMSKRLSTTFEMPSIALASVSITSLLLSPQQPSLSFSSLAFSLRCIYLYNGHKSDVCVIGKYTSINRIDALDQLMGHLLFIHTFFSAFFIMIFPRVWFVRPGLICHSSFFSLSVCNTK